MVRVLVFGAGALGSFVAALLSRRNEVTIVARHETVAVVRSAGFRVHGLTEITAHPMAVTDVEAVPSPVDVALLTVKAYDTEAACASLAKVRPVVAVTMQNGLDNARHLERVSDRVVVALTSIGVTRLSPGVVRHAGLGPTVVGAWRANGGDAAAIASMLTDAGLAATVADDVHRELWLKAAVNAGINPLTAIHRVVNGALLSDPALAVEMVAAAREVARVAAAAGIRLDEDEVETRVREVAASTAGNRSSMLQDVERGSRTEIEAITGIVLREARRLDVAAPVNERLYVQVRGLEKPSSARA